MDRAKVREIYSKLKANHPEDILRHFPKKYESNQVTNLNGNFFQGQSVVLFGVAENITSIKAGNIIRFEVNSSIFHINTKAMIFNQPFYLKMLSNKASYFFFGTYSERLKLVLVTSILSTNNYLVQLPFRPIYSLPTSISQSNFYILIHDILENDGDYIVSNLPKKYIDKYKLEPIFQAYKDVHIPFNKDTIYRGLRVFKYMEALKYALVNLYNLKNQEVIKKKEMLPIDKSKINDFILKLPFKLTKNQIEAIREIILDMDSTKLMNRLLEGDVGTGKTIVCFTCLYANYLRKGQGVLLAPTQTLANQHYQNALETFKDYDIKICLLTSNTSSKEIKLIKEGYYNIVIGTHSVFSNKVEYKDLTLTIIDEQHKFGVKQRQQIIQKGLYNDVLMMSATPIPQTLTKIIVDDLSVSVLKSFPFKEREVTSKVVTSDDPIIFKSISHALEIKKQVYIVAPKIEDNEKSNKLSSKYIYEEMVKKYGEENIGLLTGKMKLDEQEKVYEEFKSGKKLILVSTSLIEVGVDVKNASLLIIYEANYFGLASLHQLRGRIGRNGQKAFALFIYDKDDQQALDKLNYLASTNDGEKIAIYDLEHRGGGDLLSLRQVGNSFLQVANFVKDQEIFKCAKQDAKEILENENLKENKLFIQDTLKEYAELSLTEK